jgi:hypothetical protein
MTQQYLAGEMSLLLEALQTATANPASVSGITDLRREAETSPLKCLSWVAVRALVLTDGLCWESLAHGDAVAFARQAAVGAELHEFGVCAGLIDDG